MSPVLRRLFQLPEYRFQFAARRSEADWFDLRSASGLALAERRRWLRDTPKSCLVWLPEAAPLLGEILPRFVELADSRMSREPASADTCRELGTIWEPDFVLMKRIPGDDFRLVGGCVCFPSGWRVTEKLGLSMDAIHEPVPTLNASMGERIRRFLAQLAPGQVFERENWGLAAHGELNAHPDLPLPRLGAGQRLDEVWLRVEHQAFIPLPMTDGLLFVIRLAVHPLTALLGDADVVRDFARMLATMPEPIAEYKGLALARPGLLRQLETRAKLDLDGPAHETRS